MITCHLLSMSEFRRLKFFFFFSFQYSFSRASDSLSENENGRDSSSEDDGVKRGSEGKHKSMEKKTGIS